MQIRRPFAAVFYHFTFATAAAAPSVAQGCRVQLTCTQYIIRTNVRVPGKTFWDNTYLLRRIRSPLWIGNRPRLMVFFFSIRHPPPPPPPPHSLHYHPSLPFCTVCVHHSLAQTDWKSSGKSSHHIVSLRACTPPPTTNT